MSNIRGVNGYSGPNSIRPQAPRDSSRITPTPPKSQKDDQVEISPIARFLSAVATMPEIRVEKVEEMRQSLANGTYDIEGKFPTAVQNMLDEYSQV